MIGKLVGDRANQGVAIRILRVHRQPFANLDTTDVGRNGIEQASIFTGSFRLEIIHLHVWGPARQPDQNHRGIRFSPSSHGTSRIRLSLKTEGIPHAQTAKAQRAGL